VWCQVDKGAKFALRCILYRAIWIVEFGKKKGGQLMEGGRLHNARLYVAAARVARTVTRLEGGVSNQTVPEPFGTCLLRRSDSGNIQSRILLCDTIRDG
jgi:hypothetical protein